MRVILKKQSQKDTNSSSYDNLSIIENPYFRQKPPGLIPEPFAPGIVTTDNWEARVFLHQTLKSFIYLEKLERPKKKKR